MIVPHVVFTSLTSGEVWMHKVLAKTPRGAAQRVRSIIRPSGEEIERKPRPWPLDGVELTPNAAWPPEEFGPDE
jgi:hypothetical protein